MGAGCASNREAMVTCWSDGLSPPGSRKRLNVWTCISGTIVTRFPNACRSVNSCASNMSGLIFPSSIRTPLEFEPRSSNEASAGGETLRITRTMRGNKKAGRIAPTGFGLIGSSNQQSNHSSSCPGLQSSEAAADARLNACSRPTISEDGRRLSKLALSFLSCSSE